MMATATTRVDIAITMRPSPADVWTPFALVWKILAILLCVATAFLLFTPDVNEALPRLTKFAKVLKPLFQHSFLTHTGVFALVAALAWMGWGKEAPKNVGICLIILAVGLEVGQIWVPNRSAGVSDLSANLLGVGIGVALIFATRQSWARLFGRM